MFYLQLLFSVLFIFFTAYGYVKNKRNIMLAGAICLIVATAAEPLLTGVNEGFLSSQEQAKYLQQKD
ncbi:hypothetical protein ACFO4O_10600 [Glaciecola siphonariae]|uniref:Uncharacterized protein n=1 Tax=Glaciecola siphonariae TaxID=521012 RepID=A0ABV9LXN0_9ALTE